MEALLCQPNIVIIMFDSGVDITENRKSDTEFWP